MKTIVAATDFSTRSQRALRRAGLLARQFGAEVTLVHVVDDDQPEALVEVERREADRYLNEQMTSLAELRDSRCRAVVTTGEAFDSILQAARNASADLIVMGMHRKQLLRDTIVGTTIERVIRTGPYPVLMVNKDAAHSYGHVLAAVDMSKASAHAIQTAAALGLLGDAAVSLIHAFLAPGRGMMFVANAPEDQIEKYVASERLQAREELLAFLAAHEIGSQGWRHRIEEGGAFEVISKAVKETTPDLVVIGTHGRSGIVKMLIGSVAEEVLRSIDVDILAVPPIR
ncbi:MAG: universal stress protein [Pseudolabrys sp.]|nr:universal stress protein [Pseudolabrys sp.]MDP2298254.1 universal stress protein [Pseudolabrys sp.]